MLSLNSPTWGKYPRSFLKSLFVRPVQTFSVQTIPNPSQNTPKPLPDTSQDILKNMQKQKHENTNFRATAEPKWLATEELASNTLPPRFRSLCCKLYRSDGLKGGSQRGGCGGCVGRMLGRYWGVLGDYSECLGEILAGYSNNPTKNGSAQNSNVASSDAGSNAEKRTTLGSQHSFMQRMLQCRNLLAINFRQASATPWC